MKKYKRGITFGAFEIFHQGHYNILKNAKEQCEELIVCISDDEYIKGVKGHSPEICFELRRAIVRACKFVDRVGIQSEYHTKKKNVEVWQPDVIFVGDDWTPKTFKGEGMGVPVVYLPRTPNISSSKIRGNVVKLKNDKE